MGFEYPRTDQTNDERTRRLSFLVEQNRPRIDEQWDRQRGGILVPFDEEGDRLPSDVSVETIILDKDPKGKDGPADTFFVIGGLGEDLQVMRPFLIDLAACGKQVIALSVPSSGHSSDVPASWRRYPNGVDKKTFQDYTDLFFCLISRFSSQSKEMPPTILPYRNHSEKITVVGHSLGGLMAADFCAAFPQRVARAVLLAPGGVKSYPSLDLSGFRMPVSLAAEVFSKNIFARLFGQEISASEIDRNVPPVLQNLLWKNFLRSGGASNIGVEGAEQRPSSRLEQRVWEGYVAAQGFLPDRVREIAKAGVPVDIVAFEHDTLLPADAYLDLRRSLYEGDGTMINVRTVNGASHYGPIEKPIETIQKMLNL